MPPKKQAKPRALRCAYVENGRQCKGAGTGNPPLCEAHRVVLEAEANRPRTTGSRIADLLTSVLRGKKITDEQVVGGVEDFVDMFTRASGDPTHDPYAAARARAQDFFRRNGFEGAPRQHQRQAPPRRPPPGPDPRIAAAKARQVLGFNPGDKLTEDMVKKRHRELARKHHPDRGGSVARMQEINAAVDHVLATL